MTSANGTDSTASVGERLPAALAAVWRAIQRNHPDVPSVVLTLGVSQAASQLCQMAENRWPVEPEAASGHRLVVSDEVLRHGAEGALQALLHAATHGLAAARGIADTSRRGQYHNKKFMQLGQELGLEVDDAGRAGWAATSVPPATAETYTVELNQLSPILAELPAPQAYRPPAEAQHSRGKLRAECACPNPLPIWASARTLAEKRPTCSICGHPFTAEHNVA